MLFDVRKLNIIISSSHKNWVLGHLAFQIKSNIREFEIKIVEFPFRKKDIRSLNGAIYLSKTDINFFIHQDLALKAFNNGWLKNAKFNIVNFTHNNKEIYKYKQLFSQIDHVIVQNSHSIKELTRINFPTTNIHVLPNPIEGFRFQSSPDRIPTRDIIFVSHFYERKRPQLILDTIQKNQDLTFTLYGKHWTNWNEFESLVPLPNFDYKEFNYAQYPKVLAQHKVFCSLSAIEGGPVPLIESLASGLIPVVTDTGTARDIIPSHLHNLILPIDVSIEQVSLALREGLNVKENKFTLMNHLTYEGFTKQVSDIIRKHL